MFTEWLSIQGWLTEVEGIALQNLCHGKRVLEVGSYKGRSTRCMAPLAKEIWCVDTFRGDPTWGQEQLAEYTTLDEFLQNVAGFDVQVCIGKSQGVIPGLPDNYFDLIFIDSYHTYDHVKMEYELCLPKLAESGVMAFHDYDNRGIKKFIDETFDQIKLEGWVVVVKGIKPGR